MVVPVLNEERHLEAAIRSVLAQDYEGTLEVCLALGPSTDATDRIAQNLAIVDPRIQIVPNPSGGRSSGLNAAIRRTSGRVIVRVDAHSVLPPGYIRRAVETMRRTGAANVGGIQHAVGRTPFERSVARALSSPFGMGGARYHSGGLEGPVDTVFLGTFERDTIESVGLFDENVEGNEDYELNIRLRDAGAVVWFDPELSVDYTPRSSLGELAGQFFRYGTWKRHVTRLHPSSLRPRQIVPPLALIALIATLVSAFWWPPSLVVPVSYALSVLIASIATGRSVRATTLLLVIFPTMHMSWGLGFIVGGRRSARVSSPR